MQLCPSLVLRSILCLLLFFLVLPMAYGQTYDMGDLWSPGGRCVNTSAYIDSVFSGCRPYIIGQNYTYIDDLQPQREQAISGLAGLVLSSNNCTKRAIQLICGLLYRECYFVDVPGYGIAEVGRLPCKSFCYLWQSDCLPYLQTLGYAENLVELVLNCTVLSPFWMLGTRTYFEDAVFTAPLVGRFNTTVNATLPCSDRTANIFIGPVDYVCPEGTHNVRPDACAINCPEPLISSGEYDEAELMLSIVGWFSFIGTAFVVVSFMLSPKDKLAYPSVLSFFFCVCIMCLSFTFCLGSMVGHEEIWCEDNSTPHRWGDGWCTIQGITYVYFTLAGGLWWLSIGINLMATVVFKYSPTAHDLFHWGKVKFTHAYLIMAICHLLCWGIPLVVLIITLSSHHLGFGGSDFWCSIHSDEDVVYVISDTGITTEGTSDAEAIDIWNLILLTIPMMLITLIGTCLFLIVVVVALIRTQQRLLFFFHQWRLLGLLLLYMWIYSFVFSAHLQFSTQRKQQYEDYAGYIQCLKVNGYVGQFIPGSVCEVPSQVNFVLWIIASFNVATGGFFVFLIFGTSRGVFTAWANALLFVFTCGKKSSWTSGSTSGDSSASSRSGKVLRKIVNMPMRSMVSGGDDYSMAGEGGGGNGDDDDDDASFDDSADTSDEDESHDTTEREE